MKFVNYNVYAEIRGKRKYVISFIRRADGVLLPMFSADPTLSISFQTIEAANVFINQLSTARSYQYQVAAAGAIS